MSQSTHPTKIYDCFTYFNEAELLRVRLEELDEIVDHFVVVEASETFTGQPKPYYFDDLPDWISRWSDRIIRVKVAFPKNITSAWDREHYQRNAILRGLVDADPKDLVIISDADEIPRASAIEDIKCMFMPVRLGVRQYFWDFQWQVPDHCNQGARPVVCFKKDVSFKGAQWLRACDGLTTIPEAGWHFSFFGEPERIKKKIESFAHTEYDQDEYKDAAAVLNRMKNGIDPFDRFPLKWSVIDHSYPRWVQEQYG